MQKKNNYKLPGVGKSRKLWKEARELLPQGSQLLSKKTERLLPKNWPSYFKKAKGVEVVDLDGNKFIDMSYMSVGPSILGFADMDVNKAVKKVIDDSNISTLNGTEDVELAKLLIKIHPWAGMARFARTGGEAMAEAIRIARSYVKKDKTAFCGYHGWHDWYLSSNLGGAENLDGHLMPGLDPLGVPRTLQGTMYPFHYNKIEELEKITKENDIGIIVMEPMRHKYPENNFLKKVRKIADKIGAILVFDEISTGWRVNVGGIHLTLGVNPDIAVFSKAMSNGFPMAAIIGKKEIMKNSEKSFISSSYWAERIGPIAALATIYKLQKNKVPAHLKKIGGLIWKGWEILSKKHRLNISIYGPEAMLGFSFDYPNALELRTLFTQEMLKRGYLAVSEVYVSFAHKENHIKNYLKNVDEVFGLISQAIKTNSVSRLLEGPVIESGFKRLT